MHVPCKCIFYFWLGSRNMRTPITKTPRQIYISSTICIILEYDWLVNESVDFITVDGNFWILNGCIDIKYH